MAAIPKYAQRIARLPHVFEILAAHPAGLSLTELAAQAGVAPGELREDLLAFYTADVNLFGLSRPAVLEFLGPSGGEDDPNDAEFVRIIDERPSEELGVEYVDASELALIYTAASALLELYPDDDDLLGALDVLSETIFGDSGLDDSAEGGPPTSGPRALHALEHAVAHRFTAAITYSRAWHQGVTSRVIEPYRLVQTRRGWEVDAGPADASGRLRTYLVSNIRSLDVTSDTFVAPDDLPARLEAQRGTTTVRVRIPHGARWAADFYAERVQPVEDDETMATLDVDLLEPVEHRVGLLLLVAGGDAQVLDPAALVAAGPGLARVLLAHHK